MAPMEDDFLLMTRRFILWHTVAIFMASLGCASEETFLTGGASAPDVFEDTAPLLDILSTDEGQTKDGAATDLVQDSTWQDVQFAPELPEVFIDCQVTAEFGCGDVLSGVTNGGEGATHLLGWYACQPEVKAMYAASPERTYRFTAAKNMRVTVQETSETNVDLFAVHDVGQGCAVSASSCLAGGTQAIAWDAEEGESYFLVLDGNDGQEASLDLVVSCCEPACEGRVCGSDGCGGMCGECQQGEVCDGGQCAEGSTLDCVPALALSCGDVLKSESFLSEDTTASVDTVNCSNESLNGPERAYTVDVQQGALVSISVDSVSKDVAGVYLLDASQAACDTNACLTGGDDKVAYFATEKSQYTLLVEGTPGTQGAYDVSVECCVPSCEGLECGDDGCGGSCGECAQDMVCVDGGCALPPEPTCQVSGKVNCGAIMSGLDLSSDSSTNTIFSASCVEGGLAGSELTMAFVPEQDGNVAFSALLEGDAGDVALMLVKDEGAGCNADACVAGAVNLLEVEVLAGESYFLIVDGLDGAEGQLALEATCCIPDCSGKGCGDDGCGGSCGTCGQGSICEGSVCAPLPAPTCSPAADLACGQSVSGNLPDDPFAADTIYGYSCNPFDYSGAEMAYAFSAPVEAKVQVTLKPGPNAGELDVFWLEDADGVCNSAHCKAWGDSSLNFHTEAQEVGYLLVDGFMGAGGAYELSVDCCYPSCMNKLCGQEDGCGGVCGCDEGSVCLSGVCQKPSKGNSCEEPWLIGQLPYEKTASTAGAFADNVNTAGGCDSLFGVGDGVADVVYEYVVEKTGEYQLSLENLKAGASPSVLYVLSDCGLPTDSCVGYSDKTEEGGTELIVALEEGGTVFIVVDGILLGDVGDFTFKMQGPL